MADCVIWLVPTLMVLFFLIVAPLQWWHAGRPMTEEEKEKCVYPDNPAGRWVQVQYHNEAVYKNFAFFLQITTAVLAGIGYVRFKTAEIGQAIADQAMLGLSIFEMIAVFYTLLAITQHISSKLRRFRESKKGADLGGLWNWLDTQMLVIVWGAGTFVWLVGMRWR